MGGVVALVTYRRERADARRQAGTALVPEHCYHV